MLEYHQLNYNCIIIYYNSILFYVRMLRIIFKSKYYLSSIFTSHLLTPHPTLPHTLHKLLFVCRNDVITGSFYFYFNIRFLHRRNIVGWFWQRISMSTVNDKLWLEKTWTIIREKCHKTNRYLHGVWRGYSPRRFCFSICPYFSWVLSPSRFSVPCAGCVRMCTLRCRNQAEIIASHPVLSYRVTLYNKILHQDRATYWFLKS